MRREINLNNIESITLLSKEEYKKYSDKIPTVAKNWWLRSPGGNTFTAACVFCSRSSRSDVFVGGGDVSFALGVRPALQISNPESMNLETGDTFSFGEQTFTYLGEGLALCDDCIGECTFRKDYWKVQDVNDYEKSDVKAYVESWLEKQLFLEQNREKVDYYKDNYDMTEESAVALFKNSEENALHVEEVFSSLDKIAEWYLDNEVGTLDTFVAIALNMEILGETVHAHRDDIVYLGKQGYALVSEGDRWDLELDEQEEERE